MAQAATRLVESIAELVAGVDRAEPGRGAVPAPLADDSWLACQICQRRLWQLQPSGLCLGCVLRVNSLRGAPGGVSPERTWTARSRLLNYNKKDCVECKSMTWRLFLAGGGFAGLVGASRSRPRIRIHCTRWSRRTSMAFDSTPPNDFMPIHKSTNLPAPTRRMMTWLGFSP